MGRVVLGRVLMGRVVRGASCFGASGPGTIVTTKYYSCISPIRLLSVVFKKGKGASYTAEILFYRLLAVMLYGGWMIRVMVVSYILTKSFSALLTACKRSFTRG